MELRFDNYYEGFSNETLWPLYHDAVVESQFHRDWWESYQQVNERFAEAAAELAAPGATVWVHDYQLQLVPQLLRRLRPDVRIGFFLHIPFPPVELFMRLPWRTQIVSGLLGADLIGFQLPGGARNFARLAKTLTGAVTTGGTIEHDGRTDPGRAPIPISIDSAAQSALAATPKVHEAAKAAPGGSRATRRRSSWASTGWTTPRASTSGCARSASCSPRSDPAVENAVMVQIATPSRERLGSYRRMREADRAAGRRAQRRLRPDRPAGRALPAPVPAARGPGRVLRRRRRHDRDAVPGRDEPGGQGVRRLPGGRRRGAAAVRVHRRRQGTAGRHCWSTRTTPTG